MADSGSCEYSVPLKAPRAPGTLESHRGDRDAPPELPPVICFSLQLLSPGLQLRCNFVKVEGNLDNVLVGAWLNGENGLGVLNVLGCTERNKFREVGEKREGRM